MGKWRTSLPLLRPLAGRTELTEGDVRMILRPEFWPAEDVVGTEASALSLATRCAMRALAGVDESAMAAMLVDHALPGGRRSIIVTVRGKTDELPVTETLAAVLAHFKRHRSSASPVLFATHNGGLFRRTTSQMVNRTGRNLGFEGRLWDALKTYFKDRIALHPDDDAVLCYEARLHGRPINATLRTRAAVKAMILTTDPFKDSALQFTDDALAVAAAEAAGSAIPPTYADCFERPAPPAAGHPLFAEIAALDTTQPRMNLAAARDALYLRHRPEFERMAADGSMPLDDQASLFGLRKDSFKALRARVRAAQGLPAKPPNRPGRQPGRPAATGTETLRLQRIRDASWPPPAGEELFRLQRLAKHGPFIFGLVRQRKLSCTEGAELLRVWPLKLSRMRADFEAGMFDCWLAPPLSQAERITEAAILRSEAPRRPAGQTYEDFCRNVRKRRGLRLTQCEAIEYLRNPATTPKLSPRPAMLAHEQARLVKLRNGKWPSGWKTEDFRLDMFEEHGDFACAMMDDGKLGGTETAKLFKVSSDRLKSLRAALAEGNLRHGPRPVATMAEAERRRALLLEEYDLAPPGQTWQQFCEAFGRTHGLHVPPVAARTIVFSNRPDAPRNLPPNAAATPLLNHERRRLKAIAAAPWTKSEDHDELRRGMIRDEGAFLTELIDAKKLRAVDAARLLHVRPVIFSQIRGSIRDGAIDHLIRKPLPPARRGEAVSAVREAHAHRLSGEGDTALLRRLRRLRVLLVPDDYLLKILRNERRTTNTGTDYQIGGGILADQHHGAPC